MKILRLNEPTRVNKGETKVRSGVHYDWGRGRNFLELNSSEGNGSLMGP